MPIIPYSQVATCSDDFALSEFIRYASYMVHDSKLDNNQRRITLWTNRVLKAQARMKELKAHHAALTAHFCNLLRKPS